MYEVADQLIDDRRRHPLPEGQHDILDTMLTAADPRTGERLSDENVRYQLVTFLIAGHETTSGLLTFALYELLRNPQTLAAGARAGRRGARRAGAAVRRPRRAGLPRPGPQGDAAAVADRAGVRRAPLRRGDDPRPALPRAPRPDAARAHPAAAPRPDRLGRPRALRPRPVRLRPRGGAPAERLEAVRQRAALLHRARVRAAGGDAVPGDAAPALRPLGRRPRLPALDQADAHDQARGPVHPRPAAGRPDRRRAGGRRGRRTAHRPGPPGRRQRRPAARALRLERRYLRGVRPAHRQRRPAARVLADGGAAGRGSARPGTCRRRAPS